MMAARDLIFIRDLLFELDIKLPGASVIYCDSKSAVGMTYDPVAFKKTKHILRAAEFLRDLVARQVIKLQHLSGSVMIADILTKAVNRMLYRSLYQLMRDYAANGVVSPASVPSPDARPGGAVAGTNVSS